VFERAASEDYFAANVGGCCSCLTAVNLNELISRYQKIRITKTYDDWTTTVPFIGPYIIVLGIVGQRYKSTY
jgi:hypothetical protein